MAELLAVLASACSFKIFLTFPEADTNRGRVEGRLFD